MKRASRPFEEFLFEQLREPRFAAAYLNEHLTYKGPDRLKHLLQAIRDIGTAYGFTRISRISGLSRRTLYKAFSKSGNPSLATVLIVLAAVGLGIRFDATKGRSL